MLRHPRAPPSLYTAFPALACSLKFLPCQRQGVLEQARGSGICSHLACPGLSHGLGLSTGAIRSAGSRHTGHDSGGKSLGRKPSTLNPGGLESPVLLDISTGSASTAYRPSEKLGLWNPECMLRVCSLWSPGVCTRSCLHSWRRLRNAASPQECYLLGRAGDHT